MSDVPLNIFISYSRTDSNFVDRLDADLKAQGFRPWVDRRKIDGGQKWMEELQKAIDWCQICLVVLSPEAMASKHVSKEYHYAGQEGKDIIPLDWRPAHVSLALADLQRINFQSSYQEGLRDLLIILRRLGSKEQRVEEGIILEKDGRYDEALMAYNQAIELDSNYARAYRRKGYLLISRFKRYREALDMLAQAIRLEPGEARHYLFRGDALIRIEQYDEAMAAYDEALTRSQNMGDQTDRPLTGAVFTRFQIIAAAYTGKGAIYEARDRYGEALASYEQAAKLDSTNQQASEGVSRMNRIITKPTNPGPYPISSYPVQAPTPKGFEPPK